MACLARLDRAAIHAVGRRHLDRLHALNAEADRVVDKMPDNYLYLGLLAALFPGPGSSTAAATCATSRSRAG